MLELPKTFPAPLQQISEPIFSSHGVEVFLKREDLIHPVISGNKWHKLKYNLDQARKKKFQTIISFGGAYSNHIHALAYAANCLGFNSVGIIRGEAYEKLNPTLQFAVEQGMQLHYVSRAEYRRKTENPFLEKLTTVYGPSYIIPEGGSNSLAVLGCRDIVSDINISFDVICCACGTGATLAGLISGLNLQQRAIGVAVLKGATFLEQEVATLLSSASHLPYASWQIAHEYHFGGYAKVNPALLNFVDTFERQHGVPIEPIYTGKLLYAIYDKISQGEFKRGSKIVILHSGGLQSRAFL